MLPILIRTIFGAFVGMIFGLVWGICALTFNTGDQALQQAVLVQSYIGAIWIGSRGLRGLHCIVLGVALGMIWGVGWGRLFDSEIFTTAIWWALVGFIAGICVAALPRSDSVETPNMLEQDDQEAQNGRGYKYHNKRYNFSLDVPDGWVEGKLLPVFSKGGGQLALYRRTRDASINLSVGSPDAPQLIEKEIRAQALKQFMGKDAKIYMSDTHNMVLGECPWQSKMRGLGSVIFDGYEYAFQWLSSPEYVPEIRAIIESLSFSDPEQLEDEYNQFGVGARLTTKAAVPPNTNVGKILAELAHDQDNLYSVDYIDLPAIPNVFSSQIDKANAAMSRYQSTGNPNELNEAVSVWEQILNYAQFGSSPLDFRLGSLNNAGVSYFDRYNAFGNMSDLFNAIKCWESTIDSAQTNIAHQISYFSNLGSAYGALHDAMPVPDVLDKSIRYYQNALALIPSGSSKYAGCLNNLGVSYHDRYERTNSVEDLEVSIEYWQKAVETTSSDNPYFPIRLNNLAIGYGTRYTHSNQIADLDNAIEKLQLAVRFTPSGSPQVADWLINLGNALSARHKVTQSSADQKAATEAYETVCLTRRESQAIGTLKAGQNWGNWACSLTEWAEAVRAFNYSKEALEKLYRIQPMHTAQELWLHKTQQLYGASGYALARVGDLKTAVETLEQGRARAINETLARDQAAIKQVEKLEVRTYTQYRKAVEELSRLESNERQMLVPNTINGSIPRLDLTTHITQVQQARNRINIAIERIRRLPGYEKFMTPAEFVDVANAVHPDCALVFLVATTMGSMALVLTRQAAQVIDECQVTSLWLDEFTTSTLYHLWEKWPMSKMAESVPTQSAAIMKAALDEVLPQLGKQLMGPLAARLHNLNVKRITLVPYGLLGLLPLHAAVYSQGDLKEVPGELKDGQTVSFVEQFTVTYTPSAQTLVYSQRKVMQNGANERPVLLAVGNPQPSIEESLLFARLEAEEIAGLFPVQPHLLCEADARYENITTHLSQATYLHFSCHGKFEAERPLASGLLLSAGRRLTLADILDQFSLSEARLVVLSACQTAVIDAAMVPDEVVGLPTGFLQAGVPGVVGTLWSVNDLSTMLLMRRFYELHMDKDNSLSPVEALRQAQFWLRGLSISETVTIVEAMYRQASWTHKAILLQYLKHYQHSAEEDATQRPFAHPYFWAAFTFTGA